MKENRFSECLRISSIPIFLYKLKKRIDNFLYEHGSNAKVRVGYGLTESSSACCLSIKEELREHCIGIPFPDMKFKIVKIIAFIFLACSMVIS